MGAGPCSVPWKLPFCSGMSSCRVPLSSSVCPSPDQPPEILSDYIQQATLGRGLHTHLVTYQCEDRVPPVSTRGSPRFPLGGPGEGQPARPAWTGSELWAGPRSPGSGKCWRQGGGGLGRRKLSERWRCLEGDGVPQAVLKNLAEAVGGRYHCYSPESEVSRARRSRPAAALAPGPWAQADQAVCSPPSRPRAHGLPQV